MAYTVYVDIMGGDNAPYAAVDGALMSLKNDSELHVVLGGTAKALKEALEGKVFDENRVDLVEKEQVVEDGEHNPAMAYREKKDSSLIYGLSQVKEKAVDAMVTASNTGAVMAGATLVVRRIPGVLRPAFPVGLPGKNGTVWLLDAGANVDSKPEYLLQFARMMSVYVEQNGKKSPKVGLLNIGAEPGKGNALVKEAYTLLEKEETLCFIGNVEARDVLEGVADIIVTDGFDGNIYLKTLEGVAKYMLSNLKQTLMSSLKTKIGGALVKPAVKGLKAKLDPSSVGGALLLGINGTIIKAHGNSDATAFSNAIAQAVRVERAGVNEKIAQAFAAEKRSTKDE